MAHRYHRVMFLVQRQRYKAINVSETKEMGRRVRGQPRCERCGHITKSAYVMGTEKFKKTFKVGDIVTAWSTNKPVTITAIGHHRVLFLESDGKERIGSMYLPWRLWNHGRPEPLPPSGPGI